MRNLKRALSLAMASVMLLGMMVVGTSAVGYDDVSSEQNQEAIEVLQAVGIMTGDENGNFNPNAYVTRNEMAVVMSNLMDYRVASFAGTAPFDDVPSWAEPYVAACYTNGIIAGMGDRYYGGNESVTTAQAALMLMKALGYFQYQSDFEEDWQFAKGIYRAHPDQVKYVEGDLRCYCTAKKVPGKVAIITGGGTGHLPLFLGYVGENLLDGCGVGGVFQSPSAEQIFNVSKEVQAGAGVLYLYGNYTGDIMNFDMAAEMCDLEDIPTRSIVGADDVNSNADVNARRGVAGIFFMYKCAGAKAAQMGTLDEVLAAAQKAKDNTRTVGFALTPCVIPEVGHSNFTLGENEMAMGMGIHGEPGVWNGPVKTADELAQESLDTLLKDMPVAAGEEVALLINGLGATSVEELYILSNSVTQQLEDKGIKVYRTFVGEFATSMEMAGASISIMKVDQETKEMLDMPVSTPFYCQK